MTSRSVESARLAFKRAFIKYFLELSSPAIADPTEAFATCRAYLHLLRQQLGPEEFMMRLDDETTGLAGQAEQDLRQRLRGHSAQLDFGELEERLRECFEQALGRLHVALTELPVE